jgi:hypothetical protein
MARMSIGGGDVTDFSAAGNQQLPWPGTKELLARNLGERADQTLRSNRGYAPDLSSVSFARSRVIRHQRKRYHRESSSPKASGFADNFVEKNASGVLAFYVAARARNRSHPEGLPRLPQICRR